MRGEHLRFIFVWYQDRLVLVWPGMITRHNRFWKAEVPVATNADYVDFLAEDSPEAESFARLAWQNRALDAHLMVVGMVRVTSLLHKVLTSQGARPIGHTTPAYFVEWHGVKNWNAYYQNIIGRKDMDRRRRRLFERGKISFRSAEDLDEFCAACDWMVQQKKIWMKEKGRRAAWGDTERYEGFLRTIRQELKTFGQMAAFTLLLEDKPIAVAICIVEASRIIHLRGAYDPEFRMFSAQHLLTLHLLEWGYERNLSADFCCGTDPYKKAFAPSYCSVEDFAIPNSLFGRVGAFVISSNKTRAAAILKSSIVRLRPSASLLKK